MQNSATPQLWCVCCTPLQTKSEAAVKRDLSLLLAGPDAPAPAGAPENFRALIWTALAMAGAGDNREPHYATHYQRVMVFPTRRAAAAYARRQSRANEHWSFTPQRACLIAKDVPSDTPISPAKSPSTEPRHEHKTAVIKTTR